MDIRGLTHEVVEGVEGPFAQSALRAMLENQNRIRFRALNERIEIFLPSQLMNHDLRLADQPTNAES
jgi:hypothetical protein